MIRLRLLLLLPLAAGCGRPPAAVKGGSSLADAKELMRAGKAAEALNALEKAKAENPRSAEPYLLRSQLLEQSGSFRAALDEARAARRLKPNDAIVTLREMYLSSDYTTPRELESIALAAAKLAPDNPDARLYIGNAIVRSEDSARYPEAIKAYEDANRLAPYAAAPLLGMGRLYLRMGDSEKGTAMLIHALRILDSAPSGPMPMPQITQWIEERRTATFALGQAAARAEHAADFRRYSQEMTLWSRRASELRALKNRAAADPPDEQARQRLVLIASRGPRAWPE